MGTSVISLAALMISRLIPPGFTITISAPSSRSLLIARIGKVGEEIGSWYVRRSPNEGDE